jgi:hypothetical protein
MNVSSLMEVKMIKKYRVLLLTLFTLTTSAFSAAGRMGRVVQSLAPAVEQSVRATSTHSQEPAVRPDITMTHFDTEKTTPEDLGQSSMNPLNAPDEEPEFYTDANSDYQDTDTTTTDSTNDGIVTSYIRYLFGSSNTKKTTPQTTTTKQPEHTIEADSITTDLTIVDPITKSLMQRNNQMNANKHLGGFANNIPMIMGGNDDQVSETEEQSQDHIKNYKPESTIHIPRELTPIILCEPQINSNKIITYNASDTLQQCMETKQPSTLNSTKLVKTNTRPSARIILTLGNDGIYREHPKQETTLVSTQQKNTMSTNDTNTLTELMRLAMGASTSNSYANKTIDQMTETIATYLEQTTPQQETTLVPFNQEQESSSTYIIDRASLKQLLHTISGKTPAEAAQSPLLQKSFKQLKHQIEFLKNNAQPDTQQTESPFVLPDEKINNRNSSTWQEMLPEQSAPQPTIPVDEIADARPSFWEDIKNFASSNTAKTVVTTAGAGAAMLHPKSRRFAQQIAQKATRPAFKIPVSQQAPTAPKKDVHNQFKSALKKIKDVGAKIESITKNTSIKAEKKLIQANARTAKSKLETQYAKELAETQLQAQKNSAQANIKTVKAKGKTKKFKAKLKQQEAHAKETKDRLEAEAKVKQEADAKAAKETKDKLEAEAKEAKVKQEADSKAAKETKDKLEAEAKEAKVKQEADAKAAKETKDKLEAEAKEAKVKSKEKSQPAQPTPTPKSTTIPLQPNQGTGFVRDLINGFEKRIAFAKQKLTSAPRQAAQSAPKPAQPTPTPRPTTQPNQGTGFVQNLINGFEKRIAFAKQKLTSAPRQATQPAPTRVVRPFPRQATQPTPTRVVRLVPRQEIQPAPVPRQAAQPTQTPSLVNRLINYWNNLQRRQQDRESGLITGILTGLGLAYLLDPSIPAPRTIPVPTLVTPLVPVPTLATPPVPSPRNRNGNDDNDSNDDDNDSTPSSTITPTPVEEDTSPRQSDPVEPTEKHSKSDDKDEEEEKNIPQSMPGATRPTEKTQEGNAQPSQKQPIEPSNTSSPMRQPSNNNSFATRPATAKGQIIQSSYSGFTPSSEEIHKEKPPIITSTIIGQEQEESPTPHTFTPKDKNITREKEPSLQPSRVKNPLQFKSDDQSSKALPTKTQKEEMPEKNSDTQYIQEKQTWLSSAWESIKSFGEEVQNFVRPLLF